jgi:hypothetical protein
MSWRGLLGKCLAEGNKAVRAAAEASKKHSLPRSTQLTVCRGERAAEDLTMSASDRICHRRGGCMRTAGLQRASPRACVPAPSHSPLGRLLRSTIYSPRGLQSSHRLWCSSAWTAGMWRMLGSRHLLHTPARAGPGSQEGSRHSRCINAAFRKEANPPAPPPHLQMQWRPPGRSSTTSAVAARTGTPEAAAVQKRAQGHLLDSVEATPASSILWDTRRDNTALQSNGSHQRVEEASVTLKPEQVGLLYSCSRAMHEHTCSAGIWYL